MNNDILVVFIILAVTEILTVALMLFLSKEKFYNTQINRWKPGINLPTLNLPNGEKINFKKFQKYIRTVMISSITFMFIFTAILFGSGLMVDNEINVWFWIYMGFILLWTIGIILFTFKFFPKMGHKFIDKNDIK